MTTGEIAILALCFVWVIAFPFAGAVITRGKNRDLREAEQRYRKSNKELNDLLAQMRKQARDV